jgi:hypothetical protein
MRTKRVIQVGNTEEWIKCVRKIDEHLNIEQKHYREIFAKESNICANKCPALGTSQFPIAPLLHLPTTNSSHTFQNSQILRRICCKCMLVVSNAVDFMLVITVHHLPVPVFHLEQVTGPL